MYKPSYTVQFSRDIKRLQKRGKDLEKLKPVLRVLISEERLDSLHRDHKLIGHYVGRRECHIESDWLLVYKIANDVIVFERTGTHSDLFRK